MFSYFWTCSASDLTDHSDSAPFNTQRKWELCISRWLAESLILVMDLQRIVVCLFHQLFLTWGKCDYFCRLSVLSPLCCLSTGLSTFGDLLLKLCNISGFRIQVLASAYKASGCFYLRALFRKRRALSVHRNVTAEGGLAFQLLSIHLLQVPPQLHLMGFERRLCVSRLNAEPAEHEGAANQPDSPGHRGLAPQGTNSSGTAAGISKRELSTSSPLDWSWPTWENWCHTPAGCGVTSLCRQELRLCQHWKISFLFVSFSPHCCWFLFSFMWCSGF